jgi:hypothetical protein
MSLRRLILGVALGNLLALLIATSAWMVWVALVPAFVEGLVAGASAPTGPAVLVCEIADGSQAIRGMAEYSGLVRQTGGAPAPAAWVRVELRDERDRLLAAETAAVEGFQGNGVGRWTVAVREGMGAHHIRCLPSTERPDR